MPRAVLLSGQIVYGIECPFIQVQLPTSKEASSHDVQIPLVNGRMSHQAPECAIACTVSILLGWPGSAIIIDLRVCPITTKHMLTGRHKRTTLLNFVACRSDNHSDYQQHSLLRLCGNLGSRAQVIQITLSNISDHHSL